MRAASRQDVDWRSIGNRFQILTMAALPTEMQPSVQSWKRCGGS
jgi:hypothetical protein